MSGALLVWRDHLDALIHPGRYAVTGAHLAEPSAYLASAAAALETRAQPVAVRFPLEEGWPVIVMARGGPRSEDGPARIVNVYLDPPTARALEVVDFRSSFVGWLHRFHENLTIPEYSGRAIVGWVGIAMLTLALTGIWLWWPRNGAFLSGLRWCRAQHMTTNLHHLLGFWIAVPLAGVWLTGVYLSFPQTARQVMSLIVPTTPQGQRPGFGMIASSTRLTPEGVLSAALASEPGARPAVIFLSTAPANAHERTRVRGAERDSRSDAARDISAVWRVQLRNAGSGEIATVVVDDRSGAVERLPRALAGDRAVQWMRWIHEGSHSGPIWRFVVLLTGIFPVVFVVTGAIMWWRGRRGGATYRVSSRGELQAAE